MRWNKSKSNEFLSAKCNPKFAWQENAMISFTICGQLHAYEKNPEVWTKSRKPFVAGKPQREK
jgi:hypothetical protein